MTGRWTQIAVVVDPKDTMLQETGLTLVAPRSGGERSKQAGPVARQHIITDLKEEGWTEDDPFPRDEEHYVKMGLF